MVRRARLTRLLLPLLLLAAVSPGWSAPRRQKSDSQNALRVASLLLRDGHARRAAAVLAEIDTRDKKLDRSRFYTLGGLVALKRGLHLEAARQLRRALSAGKSDPNLHLLLAQALMGHGRYDQALRALQGARPLARTLAGVYVMQVQCHWREQRLAQAWGAVTAGLRVHPRSHELQRQQVLLLLQLGLHQRARQVGQRFLASPKATAKDFAAVAEALRGARQHHAAILVLEQARLRFAGSSMVLRLLARSYLDHGKPLAAAELLARLARTQPKFRVEAAELYRRAGRLLSALYFNAQSPDQKSKVRQRLGLLIELGRYEEAATLEPRLRRLGLLTDEGIVYALAYALYKNGQLKQAERWLRRLHRPELFRRAVELRKAMDNCRSQGWACH